MKTSTEKRNGETHHFFASSLGSWRVNYDVTALVAAMKREGLPFNVFLVPGPVETNYEISMFQPVVDGH